MKTKTIVIIAGIGALILYFINKNKNKSADETSETKALESRYVVCALILFFGWALFFLLFCLFNSFWPAQGIPGLPVLTLETM